MAWPPPEPTRLYLFLEDSSITFPIRPESELDENLRPFEKPEAAKPISITTKEYGEHNWFVHRDLANDKSTLEVIKDDGIKYFEDIDLEHESRTYEWYSSLNGYFHSVKGETLLIRGFKRGDWHVRTKTKTILTCDERNFYINAELDAYERGKRVFSKTWNETVKRDLV
jgi:hypothetical protein